MRKNSYQEVLGKIKASDKFKEDTIRKMQEEINKNGEDSNESKDNSHKERSVNYRCILGTAACFTIVASLFLLGNSKSSIPSVSKGGDSSANAEQNLSELPKLTIYNGSGGMGFEGYLAYDIDDLKDSNPWVTSRDISTMPVFINRYYENYKSEKDIDKGYLNSDEMISKAEEVAALVDIKVDNIYTSPTKEDIDRYKEKTGEDLNQNPYEAVAEGDGIKVRVTSLGGISIRFTKGVDLDSRYNFTYADTSRDEAEEVLDYLINEYSQFINMKSPTKSLFGDYNIYGHQGFRYNVYDNSGSTIDRILSYNLDIVNFAPTDDGKLGYIAIENLNTGEKVGDYPIINEDEAEKLLIEGKYKSTVPAEFPGEEYIKKVELIYKKTTMEKYLIPYYRFYVEIPSMEMENGLKVFGAFYVPAVKSEYINYDSTKTKKDIS